MKSNSLTVYEHRKLKLGDADDQLSEAELAALKRYHDRGGSDYYSLINNGVKFKSYVGVLQVGQRTIQILPKLDDQAGEDYWRDRLLDMLSVTTKVKARHPNTSHLRTRPNNILDYYLTLLADAVETLLRQGLTKTYRPRQGNQQALRGRLMLSNHLCENYVHRERFYVRDQVYGRDHVMNRLLRQALHLAERKAGTPRLQNRLAELSLYFPELPEEPVSEATFDRLRYDRRTEAYRPVIGVARLLLLNYHPDLRGGRQDVLALLFDMNQLWEQFLLVSLRRYLTGYRVSGKTSDRDYWRGEGVKSRRLQPDILIYDTEDKLVALLDAKWKKAAKAGRNDLLQLFAYAHHFEIERRVALVYPAGGVGATSFGVGAPNVSSVQGEFVKSKVGGDLLWLPVFGAGGVRSWMKALASEVEAWLGAG